MYISISVMKMEKMINQGGIYNDNEGNNSITDRLIHLLEEKDKQIAKKDEQIDKLLYIISNQSINQK